MLVVKTPLRVSLFGGGTDFPEYYRTAPAGGSVLGFALDKFVYVTARELPPFFGHKFRCVWSEIELVRDPATLKNPVYRAALADWDSHGLELHYDSDLPSRSGLGSSSSFAVGLLTALAALKDGPMSYPDIDTLRYRLADSAIRLERNLLDEPGGYQDQVFAAFGGFNKIVFDSSGYRIISLGDPTPLLRHCLLFYIGQQRNAAQLEGLKLDRLAINRPLLDPLRAQVDAAQRYLAAGDYAALGALLDVAWTLKRRLAPGVSYPELDARYEAARAAGAWGGKLLGAGGGGFLFLVAPVERHAAIRAAVAGLLEIPVGWSPRGVTVYTL